MDIVSLGKTLETAAEGAVAEVQGRRTCAHQATKGMESFPGTGPGAAEEEGEDQIVPINRADRPPLPAPGISVPSLFGVDKRRTDRRAERHFALVEAGQDVTNGSHVELQVRAVHAPRGLAVTQAERAASPPRGLRLPVGKKQDTAD